MADGNKWLEWARELQFLSQCALAYCRDPYDIERFERIRAISGEMMAEITDLPIEKVRDIFLSDRGYQTPKIDTRAAILREGCVALVQEQDGRWALPGGWCDYNLTVRANAEKEALEEAGMTVRATRLVALLDHNRRNPPPCAWEIMSAFLLCDYVSGSFQPNLETVACDWFSPDDLPPLNPQKTTAEEIALCFRAAADPVWQAVFD